MGPGEFTDALPGGDLVGTGGRELRPLHPDGVPLQRGLEFGGRALGGQTAVVNEGDQIAVLVGLVDLVGGENDRGAVAIRLPEVGPEGRLGVGVEAGGGLVEEDELGRV